MFRRGSAILFPLLTFTYASHTLGAEEMGIYSFCSSAVGCFFALGFAGYRRLRSEGRPVRPRRPGAVAPLHFGNICHQLHDDLIYLAVNHLIPDRLLNLMVSVTASVFAYAAITCIMGNQMAAGILDGRGMSPKAGCAESEDICKWIM